MASKTDIANRALSKLGQGRVSNIDTVDIKAAKVMRYMWDHVRDLMLSSYPWNFAVTRTQLAADATTPSWGYAKQYTVPSDFLSLLEIKGNPDYRMESTLSGGRKILTDASAPLYIRYIRRVVDTGEFDAFFVETLSSRLAFEGCEEITQSNAKKDALYKEYIKNIKDAFAADAIQDPPLELQESEWILARESGGIYDNIDYSSE